MTTPNEELISMLRAKGCPDWVTARWLMESAADLLQSQAERIAELERESETHAKAYGLAIVERDNLRHELKTAQEGWRCECSTDDACRFARERDAKAERMAVLERESEMRRIALHDVMLESDQLRAQLAAIAATEPSMIYHGRCIIDCGDSGHQDVTMLKMIARETKLFTRPMPAQDVTELVDALQLFADALPLERSTVKTCYAVTNQMRDSVHAALSRYKGAK